MKLDIRKIEPLWDYVLVQLGSGEDTGLVLPDGVRGPDDDMATVLAVGPGLPRWQDGKVTEKLEDSSEAVPTGYCAPMPVEPGDRVILTIPIDPRDGQIMDPDITQIGPNHLLLRATAVAARIQD